MANDTDDYQIHACHTPTRCRSAFTLSLPGQASPLPLSFERETLGTKEKMTLNQQNVRANPRTTVERANARTDRASSLCITYPAYRILSMYTLLFRASVSALSLSLSLSVFLSLSLSPVHSLSHAALTRARALILVLSHARFRSQSRSLPLSRSDTSTSVYECVHFFILKP